MPGARAALARASRALRLNAACCDSACRVKPELSLSLSPRHAVRACECVLSLCPRGTARYVHSPPLFAFPDHVYYLG